MDGVQRTSWTGLDLLSFDRNDIFGGAVQIVFGNVCVSDTYETTLRFRTLYDGRELKPYEPYQSMTKAQGAAALEAGS